MENVTNRDLRILMLEDSSDDEQLIKRELTKSNFDFSLKVIDKEQELKLQKFDEFDIVLCDYNISGLDGLKAIRYIRTRSDIPIICISGSISEELGLELLEAGAEDFIKKTFLKKLPYVLKNVIHKYELKSHSEECMRKVNESSQMFDTLFEGLDNPVFLKNSDLKYLRVNAAFCELYDKNEAEIIGKSDDEIEWIHQSDQSFQGDKHILEKGMSANYEFDYVDEHGRRVWLEVSKNPLFINGEIAGILGQAKNISARRNAISIMEKSQSILQQAEELTLSGSFEYDADLDLVICSKNLVRMLGLHSSQISLGRLVKLIKLEDPSRLLDRLNESIERRKEYRKEHRYMFNQKYQGIFEILFRPDYKDVSRSTFYGTIMNVTEESNASLSRIAHQEESKIEIAQAS
ncbi:response regulator [Ekhidna sp.]|uniref:response regulator n=1 Tax=Ekhidna sp. TaxID=2608089 RepID=UPI003BA9814C